MSTHCRSYLLDRPQGAFTAHDEDLSTPGPGEILLRTRRVSVCQSDVVIYRVGLPRIQRWPAVIMHEASCTVEAVGDGVTRVAPGDLVGLGCDIPCGDRTCIHCGDHGTGDWTSCPNTQATGHEFPGFARSHALLPRWFVELGPIYRFPSGTDPAHACHLEPLACALEGLTRVNHCIEKRVVVLIGAGSQSTYALQCCQAMGARRIILVNRGAERMARVLRDFGDERTIGVPWDGDVEARIAAAIQPFAAPHFVMINAPCVEAYALAMRLMGPGTVLDAHAGVKGAGGKPPIPCELDLNNQVHYQLRCYQATHGSSMRGVTLAGDFIAQGRLPKLGLMTGPGELFRPDDLAGAIRQASSSDSLKVVIDWD